MAFLQIQFFSTALDVTSSVNVILPEFNQGTNTNANQKRKAPKVLYLLHGYRGDHTGWIRKSNVERYAAGYNLAIIMPAVNHSFYCNEANGERYWDYISEELPEVMHHFLNLSDKPEETYVAGLSMGGYGAMRLALTYPERYAAAASFSGVSDILSFSHVPKAEGVAWQRIFGDMNSFAGSEADIMYLIKKSATAPKKPWLYVSCGTADFLYEQHQHFVPALRENSWQVIDHEEPGKGHEWDFWDAEIKKFIDMIGK